MVREAAAHADEDKKRHEAVEIKNKADAFLYQAEKSLADLGDKAGSELSGKVSEAIGKLRDAIAGNNADSIQSAMEALKKPLYEMTTAAYKQEPAVDSGATASSEAPQQEQPAEGEEEAKQE